MLKAGLVIAGAASGTGKTTFTTGLIAALTRKGYQVQPFKAGPDYLDPTYHSRAAGRSSRNLDTWLLSTEAIVELFARATRSGIDFALVEGVMGLYDGKNGREEEGSTAALAKLLKLPVLAVIDIGYLSRTAGAIALGLKQFDPQLNLAGFLFNNAGGAMHYEWCKQAVEDATGLPVVGWLPKSEDWALPERHLGLIPATEGDEASRLDTAIDRLAQQIALTVDLDRVAKIAGQAGELAIPATSASLFPSLPVKSTVRIGLAQDKAFGFYYQDNLDLLEAWGAELVPFSPLADSQLPEGLDGLYLGGGFPEVFARQLSENEPMRGAIRQAAAQGLPLYAECGGLMYLCRELLDFDGQVYPMVGLLPYRTAMQNRRVAIGYLEATPQPGHFISKEVGNVRGHEFHWSVLEDAIIPVSAAYTIPAQSGRFEGWLKDNVLASYLHLHFGANPRLAPGLIKWFTRRS